MYAGMKVGYKEGEIINREAAAQAPLAVFHLKEAAPRCYTVVYVRGGCLDTVRSFGSYEEAIEYARTIDMDDPWGDDLGIFRGDGSHSAHYDPDVGALVEYET